MEVLSETLEARAERVHREAIIVDVSVRALNYERLIEGGVTATFINAGAMNYGKPGSVHETAMNTLAYLDILDIDPDRVAAITSPDDIRSAKAAGKIGILYQMQGIQEIGLRLGWVRLLARLGFRMMSLTYNWGNQFGGGYADPTDTGLTCMGRQIIHQMNQDGILVDLQHAGIRTAWDILKVSIDPPILSHGNPRNLVDDPYNTPTDLMKAVAEAGGMMGISVFAPQLDGGGESFPTVETVLDHIDFAVETMGIDHVGIGTDVSETTPTRWKVHSLRYKSERPPKFRNPPYNMDPKYHSPVDFQSCADMPKITRGLLARGYSEEDAKKILGGNLLRMLDLVWGRRIKLESPCPSVQ